MVPVSINELLLRGCTLKNSGFILGLVVYTGAETRIQMNSTAPPRKQGVQPSCLRCPCHIEGCVVSLAGRAAPRLFAPQLRASRRCPVA